MTMERKTILHHERRPGIGSCGDEAVQTTTDRDAVTCERCRARLPAIAETWPIGEEREVSRGAHTLTTREAALVERSIVGEAGEPDYRWRTLEAALAQYVRVIDDGTPMRSSFRDEMPVQGGTGNTRASGREEVIAVEVGLERAFTRPRTFRDTTLTAADQRQLYELVRFGRVETKRIAPGRKGTIRQRVPTTAAEVADRDLGGRLTPREVGLVIRAGNEAVARHLVEKGELRERAVNEEARGRRAEGEEMKLPKGYDLEGWKQIADHLGVALSTAESLAARADDANPLPVVRGYIGRAIAKSADLDAWSEREIAIATKNNRVVRSQHAAPSANQMQLGLPSTEKP